MSPQFLRLLTYLPGLCGLVVLMFFAFSAVVEQLTTVGVLHNRNLWTLVHPPDWS